MRVSLENGKTFEADVLLVAVGRGPATGGLGYEEAGVAIDRGYVTVDEYCQTIVPGVYAVGDLLPTLQLAHVGFAEGILVAEHVAGLAPRPIDYDGVPAGHLQRARGRLRRADRGRRPSSATAPTGSTGFGYDLAGNGKAQILQDRGRGEARVARSTAPSSGVHMVGQPGRRAHRRGPADLQLGGRRRRRRRR